MHPNTAFRKSSAPKNVAFARGRGFGVLAISAKLGPLISHIPFALSEDGHMADLHLVRSNPILRHLTTALPAVIAVSGPDGYVSPDWYEVPDQVPTWNYVAVHLRGKLERLPQDEMHAMLNLQSAHFENMLPKRPWTTDKMTEEVLERMMRQIVPCRLSIDSIDGTWKLGQNKPDPVRLSAADQMEIHALGQDARLLSGLMRGPFDEHGDT